MKAPLKKAAKKVMPKAKVSRVDGKPLNMLYRGNNNKGNPLSKGSLSLGTLPVNAATQPKGTVFGADKYTKNWK